MLKIGLAKWLVAGAVGLSIAVFAPHSSFAVSDPPKKDCPKDKDCKAGNPAGDEAIYGIGYWQAKNGEYAAALATLRTARNQDDPRILTMIGFSLRKVGQVDEAMGYYLKALAARPSLTSTRQYLGEAYLQKGDTARAKEQLGEIAKRCGTTCEDYATLADAIARFEKT